MSTLHQHNMAESKYIPQFASTNHQKLLEKSLQQNMTKSPTSPNQQRFLTTPQHLHQNMQQNMTKSPTSPKQQRFITMPQHHTPDSVLHLLSSVLPLLSGPQELQLQPVALAQLGSLSVGLRQVGHLLEKNHGEALDCLHLHLIKFCQDSSVDVLLRLQLLEIIELQTLGWQSDPLINAYYNQRFRDFDPKKVMADSFSNDLEPAIGPTMKSQLEGGRCNHAVALLDTCNSNQLEDTSNRNSDIILNHSKQFLCINSSSGTEPTTSSSSSSSSTLDTESFHTVFNDSSNGSIIVEGDNNLTRPCSLTEPCESLNAAVNQGQADS